MDCPEPLKSKKIVIAFHGAELGGAERQGLLLARYLQRECGAHVTVLGLMTCETGKVAEVCHQEGIEWLSFPLHWVNGRLRSRFVGLCNLALTLRRMNADFILPYTVFPNIICGLVWRFTKAEMCVWNQRDEGLYLDDSLWCRTAVRLSSKFFSNSIHGREVLQKKYGIADAKVTVLRNGVSLAPPKLTRAEWRNKCGVEDHQLAACMVANLHSFKDHTTLIKAWQLVVENVLNGSPKPKLLLAGRFDGMEDELMRMADQLNVKAHVVFLGQLDDIAGLLAASDLYVHSSMHEGMPNAVLEAMQTGLPVVATDIPGIRDVVGCEGHPFLSPPQDPQVMAGLITKFFVDPGLRNLIGGRMQSRCDECFDPDVVLRETVNAIVRSVHES